MGISLSLHEGEQLVNIPVCIAAVLCPLPCTTYRAVGAKA